MNIKFLEARIYYGRADIPSKKGVYLWIEKKSKAIVYVGITISRHGLHKRINLQHLNPNYLEYRKERQSLNDEFQIRYAIIKKTKNDVGFVKGIDKSVFRKAIGRKYMVKPGKSTVDFIIKKYNLKYVCLVNENSIKKIEKMLIKKHQPVFNTLNR